jgi:hypothetical protein
MARQALTEEQIAQAAAEYGISPNLIKSVINSESSGIPTATSPKGAQGLMQVMPGTAAQQAQKLGLTNYDPYDGPTNLKLGASYLGDMQKKYGDERLALAAYNAGPGRVDELMAQYGNNYDAIAGKLPAETQKYVPKTQTEKSNPLLNAAKNKAEDYAKDYAVKQVDSALLGTGAQGITAFSPVANGATMFSGGSTVGGTAVGTAANGGTLMSTGEVVGAGAGEAIGSSAASSTGTASTFGLGSALGVAAGLYGGYETAKYQSDAPAGGKRDKNSALGGAASGAALGTGILPGVGTAVGAVVGGLAGYLGSVFGSSKGKDQMARDQVRDVMKEQGMIGDDYSFLLADGSKYDIGKDGGASLLNYDGQGKRQAFDVDFKNPLAAETTAQSMALGMILTGGHKKLSDDFTGYITNSALSNAKDQRTATLNLQAITKQMMGQSGMDQNGAKQILDGLKTQGKIDVDSYNVAVSKLPSLFGTSQPITAKGAETLNKGGGKPEIVLYEQPAIPRPIAGENSALQAAAKNKGFEKEQPQAGASRQ